MSLRKPEAPKTEVDMVPLIDVITLLLMFLVVVGDMAATAYAVKIDLPRADQAVSDDTLPVKPEGRIVISIVSKDGENVAVVNNKYFSISQYGVQKTLTSYLEETILYQESKGLCKKHADGTYDIPVKLRIADDCPMKAVEGLLADIARVGLREIHYAALPPEPAQ